MGWYSGISGDTVVRGKSPLGELFGVATLGWVLVFFGGPIGRMEMLRRSRHYGSADGLATALKVLGWVLLAVTFIIFTGRILWY